MELRIRREVQTITEETDSECWALTVRHWEPAEYVKGKKLQKIGSIGKYSSIPPAVVFVAALTALVFLFVFSENYFLDEMFKAAAATILGVFLGGSAMMTVMLHFLGRVLAVAKPNHRYFDDMKKLTEKAGKAIGVGGTPVTLSNMLVGGSGSSSIQQGVTVETEKIRARFIVNCAGGASDQISNMIGDNSFKIKPRIGDYILLNRNQVRALCLI